jgi:hypothetical protein
MDQYAHARCDDEDIACGTNFMTMSVANLKEWHTWTFQALVFVAFVWSTRLDPSNSLHFFAIHHLPVLLARTLLHIFLNSLSENTTHAGPHHPCQALHSRKRQS